MNNLTEKIRGLRDQDGSRVKQLQKKLQETGRWTFLEYCESNFRNYDGFVLCGLSLQVPVEGYESVEKRLQEALDQEQISAEVERAPHQWYEFLEGVASVLSQKDGFRKARPSWDEPDDEIPPPREEYEQLIPFFPGKEIPRRPQ